MLRSAGSSVFHSRRQLFTTLNARWPNTLLSGCMLGLTSTGDLANMHGSTTEASSQPRQAPGDPPKERKMIRWRLVDTNDMKNIRQNDGKIPDPHNAQFLPVNLATPWPTMVVSSKAERETILDAPGKGTLARVVLSCYRASAEQYLSDWRRVVVEIFSDQPAVELVELSAHDIMICKYWPLKGILINSSRPDVSRGGGVEKMAIRHVHYFGDEDTVARGLGMSNRLTGYVFVVDSSGRIRWRCSGRMVEHEGQSMINAIRALIKE
jgi:mitochondrial ATPase complex subunit ATP10